MGPDVIISFIPTCIKILTFQLVLVKKKKEKIHAFKKMVKIIFTTIGNNLKNK